MPANRFDVVVFDCDGVMFDTKAANDAYYNSVLAHVNLPSMTPEQSAFAHMHTVLEVISHLIPDPEMRRRAEEYRQEMTYLPFLGQMVIEPHLKSLLAKIRPPHSTAIATNRTNTIQQVLLDHGLETSFDLVISASDVERPKPFPDQLQKIINHFNINASRMLYIGDSQVDELAATAARVPFVAYQNKQLAADYHISSLNEIEVILRGRN